MCNGANAFARLARKATVSNTCNFNRMLAWALAGRAKSWEASALSRAWGLWFRRWLEAGVGAKEEELGLRVQDSFVKLETARLEVQGREEAVAQMESSVGDVEAGWSARLSQLEEER